MQFKICSKLFFLFPLIVWLGKRFSQQGMIVRIRIDGRRLNLPNCKQTKQGGDEV